MTYSIFISGRLHIKTQLEDVIEEELFELQESGTDMDAVKVVQG